MDFTQEISRCIVNGILHDILHDIQYTGLSDMQ